MSASIRTMYHTQERRGKLLTAPIICVREDAWLGEGYYFWDDIIDAEIWGRKSKTATGHYEIYVSRIQTNSFLDTVFNENHYRFWLSQIEKVANLFISKTSLKPTIKEINEYFLDRGVWIDIDGIIFQDISENQNNLKVKSFYYRKRIQAVVFNIGIINTFALHKTGMCKTKPWY